MVLPKISLEQWAAFKAVVDEGSYAKAADALNKSQSTISYAISRLNELLATPALTLVGRKAELTAAGVVLYRHAQNLLAQAQATEKAAQFLKEGWETQLKLVCDVISPMRPVLAALQAFSNTTSHTRIKIIETSLSGTEELILNRECDLAIVAQVPIGFLSAPLRSINLVAVAHKDHPLTQLDVVTETDLKMHRQIVVRDSGTKREQNVGWLGSEQRWTVSHFATSVDAVNQGLGFAFLPDHRIAKELAQGTLVALPLEIPNIRPVALSLILTNPDHAGPAAKALSENLRTAFKTMELTPVYTEAI